MKYAYVLNIPANQLKHATDMLRYDGAFEVRFRDEDTVMIEMLSFTPGRWESFGVGNLKPIRYQMTAATYRDKIGVSDGFTRGLRFFQQWMKHSPEDKLLVQE